MRTEGDGDAVLFTGAPVAFGDGSRSAIHKRPATEALWLSASGLRGDEQADRTHHGGVDRALCQYPADHLPFWRQRYPARDGAFAPGAFGENVSTLGWDEDTVSVGDLFRLGEALVQVSQPRQPCWKVNTRFGIDELSRAMVESRRTGWLCRVVSAGWVPPDAKISLEQAAERPLKLSRLWSITVDGGVPAETLQEAAAHPALAEAWRLRLRTRADWLLKKGAPR